MNATTCQPVDSPSAPRMAEEGPARGERSGKMSILRATYAADFESVAGYLLRRTGDPDLAVELASETFVEAVGSLHRWSPQGIPLRGWLFRIATRRLWHHRRRRGRMFRLLTRVRDSGMSSAKEERGCEDAARVRVAISRLRASHQDVLVLHHVEAMSIAEVALTLGVAEGTVKSRLSRARASLIAHLAELGVHA